MSGIRENLNQATAGIVCVTRESRNEPWLLYEAGALSTKAIDRLWTVLLDVGPADVAGPLTPFNHTKAERSDVLKMIYSIWRAAVANKTTAVTEETLKRYFDHFWKTDLEPKIAELQARDPAPPKAPDYIGEILSLSHVLVERVNQSSWRQDKTLQMMHVLYETIVGQPAPGLAKLREVVRESQARGAALNNLAALAEEALAVSDAAGTKRGDNAAPASPDANPDAKIS